MVHNASEDPSDAPSKVRVMALKCLAVIPAHVRDIIALPFKFEVLRELEKAVNDVKRNVREAAVQCRSTWFNLAATVEDDDD